MIDWKKYLIVFLITVSLFLSASYISNYFGDKKINQLKSIQDNISIDILSSETQFSLLSELSCKNISARCEKKSAFLLYFYTTAENCSEGERQGLVLTSLREEYPELRVYSFD